MFKRLLLLSSLSVLASCGGGGGGSEVTPTAPTSQVLQGVFIDSPVMGLSYRTATQSGLTDSSGTFSYLAGEQVSFALGGIEFGSAAGAAELTPLNLVGANSFDQASPGQRRQLTNQLLILQSLDRDQNPDNGIDLTGLDTQLVNERLNFDMSVDEFSSGRYLGLVADAGGQVIEQTQALNHFFQSIDTTITIDLPGRLEQDFDADGITDSERLYEYNADGQPTRVTINRILSGETRQTVQAYEYQPNGLLSRRTTSSIAEDGTAEIFSEQTFEYNDQNQVISASLVREGIPTATLTRTYDRFGRLETQERRTPVQIFATRIPLSPPAGFVAADLNVQGFGDGAVAGGSIFTLAGIDSTFRAIQPADIVSISSAVQLPLDLSVPGLLADAVFSGSQPAFSGLDISLERFEYSEQGHVASVVVTESSLAEGVTEPVIQSQQTRTYDAEGRLLVSVNQVLGFEVESRFAFADNGRLESCSVAVDAEILIENTDPIGSAPVDNEQYLYTGRCMRLTANLIRSNANGEPELIETFFAAFDAPPFNQNQPARTSRQEIITDADGAQRLRTTPDITAADIFFDQVAITEGNVGITRNFNSQGEEISVTRQTIETLVLNQLPPDQPVSEPAFSIFGFFAPL